MGKMLKVNSAFVLYYRHFDVFLFQLYVYNVDMDNVREVSLTPNSSWGGEGCLGCDIGYGIIMPHLLAGDCDIMSIITSYYY